MLSNHSVGAFGRSIDWLSFSIFATNSGPINKNNGFEYDTKGHFNLLNHF